MPSLLSERHGKSPPLVSARQLATVLVIMIWSAIPIHPERDEYGAARKEFVNVDLHGLDETGQGFTLDGVAPGLALSPEARDMMRRIGSQTIDQSLHFLMGAGPVWASRSLAGVPWYGWLITPVLIYREWRQWPSNRWWDPPLDWTFLSLGVATATWGPALRRRARRRLRGAQPRLEAH